MTFLSELVGSFSTGAAENPTVEMMEAAFAFEGLDWRYVNCEVPPANLADAVRGATALGWRGFNCSVPHKQTVIPLIDELSDSAQISGAVNCVNRTDGGWTGHNTDGVGFVESVVPHVQLSGCEALVIGSGGAAHAIAIELGRNGASVVHLASRNKGTAGSLAQLVTANTAADASLVDWVEPLTIPACVSMVVNATPVGMAPDHRSAIAVDWTSLPVDAVVADVVVNPSFTTFLQNASETGSIIIDGRGMLVNQAAENIRLWTGIDVDKAPMLAALDSAFDQT